MHAHSTDPTRPTYKVVVIGAGPAGLMAADVLADAGLRVEVFDAMPSAGRKFLQAGRGGLNLSHSEPLPQFVQRYGAAEPQFAPWVQTFGPSQLRAWVASFGIETFIGSTGRIYPQDMKAAPLLRAWLHRLREKGVLFAMHHRWQGWDEHGALEFTHRQQKIHVEADALILALGGASWPQLGSRGDWLNLFAETEIEPWRAANCGFDCEWSALLRDKFAGQPLKSVAMSVRCAHGAIQHKRGELMLTEYGLEGGLLYALSAPIRDGLQAAKPCEVWVDLLPDLTVPQLQKRLQKNRGKQSWSTHLKRAGVDALRAHLLRERLEGAELENWTRISELLKAYPLHLTQPRPIAEAISSAGGIRFSALDENTMLRSRPGVFCCGEMLDWEAPTGGYLLTGVLASARASAQGVLNWLEK
ncbi:MAG: TIGR03862 family flavoprotein [Thiotrichales bacterium]|nr:TIGR03862 family flavoprotein [Thiotrichales bacterium]